MVVVRTVEHFGAQRLYFMDEALQRAYEQATDRRTVSDGFLTFLRLAGVEVQYAS